MPVKKHKKCMPLYKNILNKNVRIIRCFKIICYKIKNLLNNIIIKIFLIYDNHLIV